MAVKIDSGCSAMGITCKADSEDSDDLLLVHEIEPHHTKGGSTYNNMNVDRMSTTHRSCRKRQVFVKSAVNTNPFIFEVGSAIGLKALIATLGTGFEKRRDMRYLLCIVVIVIIFAVTEFGVDAQWSNTTVPVYYKFNDTLNYDDWKLDWSDDFNQLDPAIWNIVDTGVVYSNESQYYSKNNSYIQDGKLVIKSINKPYGGKKNLLYGRIEASIKLPVGKGVWPAFWLMPDQSMDCYLSQGEFDIFESVGYQKIYQTFHHSVNPPKGCSEESHRQKSNTVPLPGLDKDYHLFSLVWAPHQIAYLVDNRVTFVINNTVPDFVIPNIPFYMIFNTAIGGNWPGYPNASNVWPQYHYVDYVKIYKYSPDFQVTPHDHHYNTTSCNLQPFTIYNNFRMNIDIPKTFVSVYKCLSDIEGSIFSDFGRSEPFIIDGDALLLMFASKVLDGDPLVSRDRVLFMRDNSLFYVDHTLLLQRTLIIEYYDRHFHNVTNNKYPNISFKVIDGRWWEPDGFGEVIEFYLSTKFSFLMIMVPTVDLSKLYDDNALELFLSRSTKAFNHYVELATLEFLGSTAKSFIYSLKPLKTSVVEYSEPSPQINPKLSLILTDVGVYKVSVIIALRLHHPRDLCVISSLASILTRPSDDPLAKAAFQEDAYLPRLICLYLALMESLPISQRVFTLPDTLYDDESNQICATRHSQMLDLFDEISLIIHINLSSWLGGCVPPLDMFDIKLCTFISLLIRYKSQPLEKLFDQPVISHASSLWSALKSTVPGLSMVNLLAPFSSPKEETRDHKEILNIIMSDARKNKNVVFSLYKIQDPFINSFLTDVQKTLTFETTLPVIHHKKDQQAFYDITHTHCKKLLADMRNEPDAFIHKIRKEYKFDKRYSEKGKQKAMLKYHRHAASLYDVSKKLTITELVEPVSRFTNNPGAKTSGVVNHSVSWQTRNQPVSKHAKLKKKDLVAEKHKIKQSDDVKALHSSLKKEATSEGLIKLLNQSMVLDNPEYIPEYAKGLSKLRGLIIGDKDTKPLYQLIQSYLRAIDSLGKDVVDDISRLLVSIHKTSKLLNMPDFSDVISIKYKLKLEPEVKPEVVDDPVSAIKFQMKETHETLVRNTGSSHDPRIKHFLPDKWQRDLLDAVDKRESALICAPTSSGKTFISFYAFESILKESNDGVVVYVSPTKALVTQMYSEVLGRYDKNYENIVGKSQASSFRMAGIFTRDYRMDDSNCQILITVPQCLDLLFLSLTSSGWIHRIKYVIFDEVHQIANGVDGAIWEQLLLMNPAPFLALSATISNLGEFHAWLQDIDLKRKVLLIDYPHRFNDLKFYHCTKELELQPIHPMATIQKNKSTANMFLLSEEALDLYNRIEHHFGTNDPNVVLLSPDVYFRGESSQYDLQKQQIYTYQRDLLDFIESQLLLDPSNPSKQAADKVVASFSNSEVKLFSGWMSSIPKMIDLLKSKNLLPVIVFIFDREACERAAEHLKATVYRKYYNPLTQVKVDETTKKIEALQREINRFKPPLDDCIHTDLGNLKQYLNSLTARKAEYGTVISSDIIDYKFNSISSHRLYSALLDGIGVHHSGLDKNYLECVEMLFRRKKIHVIFATGSLALGINMPCRSVVVAGDSPYLNTLSFRQLSGRAGRRGFENRGHVIFFGLDHSKTNFLLNSKVSQIVGNSVLSPSLILLIIARNNLIDVLSDDRKERDTLFLTNSTRKLIDKSFFLRKYPLQNQYVLQFSADYLYREGYLNIDGQALGYSGIITHLHYLEPYNFIFCRLLKDGVFNQFTKNTNKHELTLLTILCYLFNRKPIAPTASRICRHVNPDKMGPSLVHLPPLPESVEKSIKAHNKSTIFSFKSYLNAYQNSLKINGDLPLSPSQLYPNVIDNPDQSIKTTLPLWTKHSSEYMSPAFVPRGVAALSSSWDSQNSSPQKLSYSMPFNTFFDLSVLPICPPDPSSINSYLLDFYKHGQIKTIHKYNRSNINIFDNKRPNVSSGQSF
eukprot:gene9819-11469_t